MKDSGLEDSYAGLEQLSDEQLCEISRCGNRDAEEILVARYHRLVRSVAHPYFLAGGDTEDLLQEGMFGLVKAVREYDSARDASFYTFAERCIRNRLYTALKSANSGKHTPLNEAVSLSESCLDENLTLEQLDPEVVLIDTEKAESLLHQVNQSLSAFEQTVLRYYLNGLTCREIAETVGKSPKSVDNAIQRMRRKIQRQLNSGDISNG